MSKLLALVDGSEYSRSVCEHAAWIAARTRWSVDVLHVLGRRQPAGGQRNLSGNITLGAKSALLEELIAMDSEVAKLLQKHGRAILDDARGILAAHGVDDVTTRLRFGDIVETVAADGAGAGMVVIGKRGEAADFASAHLGSNLERIVRACHDPVMVAARAWNPVERVLVAYDGGPSCTKALEFMAASPLFEGLDCCLLWAGDETPAVRATLERALEVLRAGGRQATARIEPGQPEKVISQRVERDGVNLLVMGAYGHSRIRTLIIGSTTTTMMRLCRVPVMLFR